MKYYCDGQWSACGFNTIIRIFFTEMIAKIIIILKHKNCNRILCHQQNRFDNRYDNITDMVTKHKYYIATISWFLEWYNDGNASKPRISKMHNVQETQKNCFIA